MGRFESFEQRFWSKVDIKGSDDCWLWMSGKSGGYGVLTRTSKEEPRRRTVHAISWVLSFGEIKQNIDVGHKCKNKLCVNPKHIYLTSHAENIREMNNRDDYLYPNIDNTLDAQRRAIVHKTKYMLSKSDIGELQPGQYLKIFEVICSEDSYSMNIDTEHHIQEQCGHDKKYIVSSHNGTHFCLMCEYLIKSQIVRTIMKAIGEE